MKFRKNAWKKTTNPDELVDINRFSLPKAWLLLAFAASLIVMLCVYALFYTWVSILEAEGVYLGKNKIITVEANLNGMVTEVMVNEGQKIKQGDVLAKIQRLDNNEVINKVMEFEYNEQVQIAQMIIRQADFVSEGEQLFVFHVLDVREESLLMVYVDIKNASLLKAGMKVHIEPYGLNANKYGYILGSVKEVSPYPMNTLAINARVGNDELVKHISKEQEGVLNEVLVELDIDPTTGDYLWTTGKTTPWDLKTGSICRVEFVVSKKTPLEILFAL